MKEEQRFEFPPMKCVTKRQSGMTKLKNISPLQVIITAHRGLGKGIPLKTI